MQLCNAKTLMDYKEILSAILSNLSISFAQCNIRRQRATKIFKKKRADVAPRHQRKIPFLPVNDGITHRYWLNFLPDN